MSIKIAHVSDIHVRKLKYHKEYRAVFEQLYEKLKEEKPDIIVNTGDTFHTKLDLSPEAIRMMSELFVGYKCNKTINYLRDGKGLARGGMGTQRVLEARGPLRRALRRPRRGSQRV